MSPRASKNTTLKTGGTPTAFTNEPTTELVGSIANSVYQITDSVKRIIDYATAVVVEVDADGAGGGGYVVAGVDTYTVDYMLGKITFAADQGNDALVRVSGSYIPLLTLASARECKVSEASDLPDTTTFDSGGWHARMKTLDDASGEIRGLELPSYDYDTGAGTKQFVTLKRAGTPVFLEYRPGGGNIYFRSWVLFDSEEVAADDPASVIEATHSWQAMISKGNGQTESALASWSDL